VPYSICNTRKPIASPTQRLMHLLLSSLLIPAGLATAGSSALGQSQSIDGAIRGQVADISGAPVQGAKVTVRNDDTGFSRTVSTDSGGLYVLPNLPIGNYTLDVSVSNFSAVRQSGIHLDAGTTAVINEQLHPGRVNQEVHVVADAPVLEPARVDIGADLTSTQVNNAPLTSRNPYDFVLFQPGVSGVPNQELGIPDYVNTNGLVDRVNYQLDGMDDTETDQLGLRLFAISQSYVDQVEQVSNSFTAEFGNTDGIIYNAITGAGTNKVHGMVQEIWRPSAVNSRPMLESSTQPTPDSTLSNPAVNIGGPILRNKLFFYGAYEYILRGEPNPNVITPANAAALGLSASQLTVAPEVEHAQFVDSRLDWTINSKNTAFLRFNYFRNEFPYNSDVGGLYALSAASDFHDRAYIEGAQLVTAFSPRLLNEFRGSWPYRNEKHVDAPTTGPGPMVYVSGVAYFNGTNINGSVFQEKIPSFNDNLTWTRGSHTLKFGVSYEKPLLTQESPIYSEFVFPSVAAYQAAESGANPFSYTQLNVSIGHPGAGFHPNFVGLFAQDTWQARKDLIVNYGFRYDLYDAPPGQPNAPFVYTQHFNTPKADFSPRLGLSWQIRPKTVVRANMGIFYLTPATDTWYNALYNNGGTTSLIAQIASSSACAPAYPRTITSVSGSCLGIPSITATTPNFRNEYSWNGNLQVQQQLAENDSLTLGYVMTNGRNIPFDRNMNLINPIGYLADGRPVFSTAVNGNTRRYPQFNNILLQDVGSNSSYNALLVSYGHRFSHGFSASANYTWGHSIDDAPEVNSYDCDGVIEDPTDRNRDRGNSCVDRPDAFNFLGVYQPTVHTESGLANHLINGNQLESTWNFMSGQPQNEVANTILNNDTTTSGYTRPLFVGRDTLRGPGIYQVDLRYTRSLGTYFDRVQPQLFAESNNLFNRHSNVTTLNETTQVLGLTNGGPTSATGSVVTPPPGTFESTLMDARILEFGARINF
jgi:hypothetical protein